VGAVVAALLLIAGCAAPGAEPAPDGTPSSAGRTPGSTGAHGDGSVSTPASTRPPLPFVATSTTAPKDLTPVEPATCAIAVADPAPRPAPSPPASFSVPAQVDPTLTTTSTTEAPLDAPTAMLRLQTDPRLGGATVSASVWVDGLGEVAAANPDLALIPASNQKLITAIGALRLLDPQERLHTILIATGPVEDGVLHGDLVLVGGGDPTLTRTGPHSLEALARAVTDAGIRAVDGAVLVDDTRYDDERARPAWPTDWWKSIGSPSALVADHNNYRDDPAFLQDPALVSAQLVQFALTTSGVTFGGAASHGSAVAGVELANLESPTINELVTIMLFRSDNLIAELLVKEIGFRAEHARGSTAAGLRAIEAVIGQLCVQPVTGTNADGSGLSRDNRRSAREIRRLLLAAQLQSWGPLFLSDLSVAGQPDALGGRLKGPATSGNVRAKGGSLAVTRSLSGYLTTASGRHAVFSVIVNGSGLARADAAIDDFVTNLARLPT
jgi:D-alanyl-D-alanine carboxypeptidase/D-alanyl-D-alanine-endopeptidase (penicillin-binding protein 4)